MRHSHTLVYQTISLPVVRPLRLAVVSDTHTTELKPEVSPVLLQALIDDQPDVMLHLGDLAFPGSLRQLEEIAPCYFVRGNRDLRNFSHAPSVITFQIGKWNFLMTHGHGTTLHYVIDKMKYGIYGYDFQRYHRLLSELGPGANVYLFGHTHIAENRWLDGKCYFNPGSACAPSGHDPHPSFGKIIIDAADNIYTEIIPLE